MRVGHKGYLISQTNINIILPTYLVILFKSCLKSYNKWQGHCDLSRTNEQLVSIFHLKPKYGFIGSTN